MCLWMGEYLLFLRSDVLLTRLVRNCFSFGSVGISVARLPVRASVLLPLFMFICLDSFFEDAYIFPTVARCFMGPLKSGCFLHCFKIREAFFRTSLPADKYPSTWQKSLDTSTHCTGSRHSPALTRAWC